MRYCDYTTLFSTHPSELVLLSTYNFDPDFFERRLLRAPSLLTARRIVVLMDYDQWSRLKVEEVTARWMNSKYLVVPIRPKAGVFHPKLQLVLRADGFQLVCGSSNLTRSGCTHNLEIVNAISAMLDDSGTHESLPLCCDAVRFFQLALDRGIGDAAAIARDWIADAAKDMPWCRPTSRQHRDDHGGVKLMHTLDGPLWDQFVECVGDHRPTQIVVVSPFYDTDGRMIRRVLQKWPKATLEVLAQQLTSNLPVGQLKLMARPPDIYEVRSASRRLHGKALGWQSTDGGGILVGSANFTAAAFDGRNIEACIYVGAETANMNTLFDSQLQRVSIAVEDFIPADTTEPRPDEDTEPALSIQSASLRDGTTLRLLYEVSSGEVITKLSVALRLSSESFPRATIVLPTRRTGEAVVKVGEKVLQDVHGSLLAFISAETDHGRIESAATWVIHEDRLTHEPSDGSGIKTKTHVEETGDGLPEYLDEIVKREGLASVVEYLNHLNIRFFDGSGGIGGRSKFQLRRSDPYHPDVPPEWWDQIDAHAPNLEQAIYSFCDRHEKSRLRRHAERGNINGMENFLDIFTAVVRLLYVYHTRVDGRGQPVVKAPQLIGRVCRLIEIATSGIDTSHDYCEGYTTSLVVNLNGDLSLLHERSEELNFMGHMCAALLIAQMLRFDPNEVPIYGPKVTRPRECLEHQVKRLHATIVDAEMAAPSKQQVVSALGQYRMLSDDVMTACEGEIS
ncbi:MAG: hypothetical protein GC162_19085 [Planctomycetes bacterium]|nr:hypothetical protein [Planctomycetota bacterium]